MRALILTAGLGTRLRPLTRVRAKAAVPVNGEPIVRRIMAWLVRERVHDLVLNLHHLPASIAAVVGDGLDLGAHVRYSWENPVLGSAGGPRRALPLLSDPGPSGDDAESTFLIVNGDTLTDVRLDEMIDAHRASGALVTLALIRNPRPEAYGGVIVEGGRVAGFTRRGAVKENFHFIGVQVAERRVFEGLPDGVPAESVGALYPKLISENPNAVAAYVIDAPFNDIGTPADYLETSLALARSEGDRLISRSGTQVDPGASVEETAVWDNVIISTGVRLRQCIVCDNVRIPAGAQFERCAIVRHDGEPPEEGERLEDGLLVKPF